MLKKTLTVAAAALIVFAGSVPAQAAAIGAKPMGPAMALCDLIPELCPPHLR
ncbi:hypothetical protein [Devriesea agamarum]|uniref:hypothetical protein n=1 Tax=Devriesea agamarum TaxID=472569 RepID=UPI0012EDEAB4|nr:hypothetical protein [Devriesea agamarum]